MKGNQYFILPQQPDPDDIRPRNAFGYLLGFGEAYTAYYEARDKAETAQNCPESDSSRNGSSEAA